MNQFFLHALFYNKITWYFINLCSKFISLMPLIFILSMDLDHKMVLPVAQLMMWRAGNGVSCISWSVVDYEIPAAIRMVWPRRMMIEGAWWTNRVRRFSCPISSPRPQSNDVRIDVKPEYKTAGSADLEWNQNCDYLMHHLNGDWLAIHCSYVLFMTRTAQMGSGWLCLVSATLSIGQC